MMNDCVFCRFADDKKIVFRENKYFFMIYDSFPVTPGHALIIPKRHVVDIIDLTCEERNSLQNTIKEVITEIGKTNLKKVYQGILENSLSNTSVWFCEKALKSLEKNGKPIAYNHGVNDGKAAGRTVDHLHRHVIPRYEGDMEDPRGGVRYVIPEMGNYKIER